MIKSAAVLITVPGLVLLGSDGGGGSGQAPLVIGGITAAPGATTSGAIAVPPRAGDAGASIPFTIIRGKTNGPVLALIAGVHGAEYPPIIALQRLRASFDTSSLRGTVIMVHVANMPSFLARTVYYSPADGKNLNRVFPGKTDGTLSERIAEAITREVIAHATHVLDLHCGDGNESLRPYSGPGSRREIPKSPKPAAPWRSRSVSITSWSTDRGRPIQPRRSICPTPPLRAASRRSRRRPAAWAWWTKSRSG